MFSLALLWTFAGCTTVENKFDKLVDDLPDRFTFWAKPAPQKPTYYLHKVRYPGETLSIIAEWYTGDGKNWRVLAKANPRLDASHISIGTRIRIPNRLLRTHKRMPRDFVKAVEKRQGAKKRRFAKSKTPSRAKAARPHYYHRVRYPGETLSIIAKWYTGDGKNWRVLAKANPQLDPGRIIVGAKIRIPNKILHTRKPMPRDFILLSAPARQPQPSPTATSLVESLEKETASPQPSPHPDEAEEMELFGPK